MGRTTEFLNVDLDVVAGRSLSPLAAALERGARLLYSGRTTGRRYMIRAELPDQPGNADEAIRGLAALVRKLPPTARRLWNQASRRAFDIGIQPHAEPACSQYSIEPTSLASAAQVKAEIVITVYGRPRSGAKRVGRSTKARGPRRGRTKG